MKKVIKIILAFFIALIIIVGGYFAYVFLSYYRIDDNLSLVPKGEAPFDSISTGEEHKIISANIGFGAYSDDYSFFMDGGTESWAFSKEATIENVTGSIENIAALSPDILLLQEVDIDSTRSYHIDEAELTSEVLGKNNYPEHTQTFAQNYDSPFLMYPLNQPHGKSVAGMLTVSQYKITNSIRRSLPIETGFSKLIDLDRCYSKNYIDTDKGNQLVVYNVHLSAYTTNPATAESQVKMLNEDMLDEVNKGNYVIAGGDMNKDLLGDSSKYFSVASGQSNNWAQPFPTDLLDDEFSLIGPLHEDDPQPSCRNADVPYDENTFVLTVDGFIVSSNVKVVDSNVLFLAFKYSDHNPVYINFILE